MWRVSRNPFFYIFVCVCVGVCKKDIPDSRFNVECINYISMVSFWKAVWYQINLIFNLPAPPKWHALFKEEKKMQATLKSYSSRSHNFCKDGNHVNAIIIMKIKK